MRVEFARFPEVPLCLHRGPVHVLLTIVKQKTVARARNVNVKTAQCQYLQIVHNVYVTPLSHWQDFANECPRINPNPSDLKFVKLGYIGRIRLEICEFERLAVS